MEKMIKNKYITYSTYSTY